MARYRESIGVGSGSPDRGSCRGHERVALRGFIGELIGDLIGTLSSLSGPYWDLIGTLSGTSSGLLGPYRGFSIYLPKVKTNTHLGIHILSGALSGVLIGVSIYSVLLFVDVIGI